MWAKTVKEYETKREEKGSILSKEERKNSCDNKLGSNTYTQTFLIHSFANFAHYPSPCSDNWTIQDDVNSTSLAQRLIDSQNIQEKTDKDFSTLFIIP